MKTHGRKLTRYNFPVGVGDITEPTIIVELSRKEFLGERKPGTKKSRLETTLQRHYQCERRI